MSLDVLFHVLIGKAAIAFLGVVSTHDLIYMLVFQYVSKLLIEAIFGTPMAYAAIAFLRKNVLR